MANQTTVDTKYLSYNVLMYNITPGAAYAFLLPSNAVNGQTAIVKDFGGTAATNNITITPPTGKLIDGSASYVMNINYQAVRLIFNGFNWGVIHDTAIGPSFTPVMNAVQSTAYTSNTVIITGIANGTAISITGGTYSINGGAFTSSPGTINNSNTLALKVTSSSLSSTAVTATVTIGTNSYIYTVTTWAGPVLPLNAGAKVMGFGHSFIGRGTQVFGSPTNQISANAYGPLPWIRIMDQRFNLDTFVNFNNIPTWQSIPNSDNYDGANQGLSGDAFFFAQVVEPGFIYRQPWALSKTPDIVYMEAGTNDVGLGRTFEQMKSDLNTVLDGFLNAGVWVVADTISPCGTFTDGSPMELVREQYNTYLKSLPAIRTGLKVIDCETIFGTSASTQVTSLFSPGGSFLHPNDAGMFALAGLVLPVLQTMVSSGSFYNTDPTVSNLFPDNSMLGTGGTVGLQTTGNVATNWNVKMTTGASTIVCSKEVISGSFEKQVLTITPIADANVVHQANIQKTASVTIASLGLNPGDWVQMMVAVELSGTVDWAQILIKLANNGPNLYNASGLFTSALSATTNLFPAGFTAGELITEPFQLPAGATSLPLNATGLYNIRFFGAATTNPLVIKFSEPILRKVTDPRIAWNSTAD